MASTADEAIADAKPVQHSINPYVDKFGKQKFYAAQLMIFVAATHPFATVKPVDRSRKFLL